jgi:hypothetical protein
VRSLASSLAPSVDAEQDERRKKRDKLAKLHRFLGSRVPVDMGLGGDAPLPDTPGTPVQDMDAARRWQRQLRRRSSSAAFPPNWGDHAERAQPELGEREKAIVVRRAQKMEKVGCPRALSCGCG